MNEKPDICKKRGLSAKSGDLAMKLCSLDKVLKIISVQCSSRHADAEESLGA